MILSYAKYIELLSALDEYSKGKLEKKELQKAIFKHYMEKYGSFVAENSKKTKKLFITKYQRSRYNKGVQKIFISFMNQL